MSPPLVHDLGVLLAKLPGDDQPDIGCEIMVLNEFAGVRRYEEGGMILRDDDVEDARVLADRMRAWARAVIARDRGK